MASAPEEDEVGLGADVDEGLTVEVVKPVVVAATEAARETVLVGEARGAVDCPLIWFWTSVLKVPVMLSKVNLAENAIAGYWGEAVSLRERDSNRMKYSELLGPMVGSTLKDIELDFETSTLGVRV